MRRQVEGRALASADRAGLYLQPAPVLGNDAVLSTLPDSAPAQVAKHSTHGTLHTF